MSPLSFHNIGIIRLLFAIKDCCSLLLGSSGSWLMTLSYWYVILSHSATLYQRSETEQWSWKPTSSKDRGNAALCSPNWIDLSWTLMNLKNSGGDRVHSCHNRMPTFNVLDFMQTRERHFPRALKPNDNQTRWKTVPEPSQKVETTAITTGQRHSTHEPQPPLAHGPEQINLVFRTRNYFLATFPGLVCGVWEEPTKCSWAHLCVRHQTSWLMVDSPTQELSTARRAKQLWDYWQISGWLLHSWTFSRWVRGSPLCGCVMHREKRLPVLLFARMQFFCVCEATVAGKLSRPAARVSE